MSEWTSEEIARAAGLEWPLTEDCDGLECAHYEPRWHEHPGACATWLLPVLERRYTKISLERHPHIEAYRWIVLYGESASIAPTWHECVIAAIMASAENNNKESENV